MKTQIIAFVAVMFKILWSVVSLLIRGNMVFLILVLFNLKVPVIAHTKFVNYPIQVFMTESGSHYERKLVDGTLKEIVNYPFNFNLYNIKDSTGIMQVTSVTSNLTIDIDNNRNILPVIFLKRIALFMIFFILFFQLDKVYSSFRKNEPFNPGNVKRLKIVAYSIMGLSPVIFLFNDLSIHIYKNYKIAGYGTSTSHSLNLQYIFFGLLILIIAYAFNIGSQLQK